MPGSKYGDLHHLRFVVIVHMIFVTHSTAVVHFQFLHNRYIVKRKLHLPQSQPRSQDLCGGATKIADKEPGNEVL